MCGSRSHGKYVRRALGRVCVCVLRCFCFDIVKKFVLMHFLDFDMCARIAQGGCIRLTNQFLCVALDACAISLSVCTGLNMLFKIELTAMNK